MAIEFGGTMRSSPAQLSVLKLLQMFAWVVEASSWAVSQTGRVTRPLICHGNMMISLFSCEMHAWRARRQTIRRETDSVAEALTHGAGLAAVN